VSSLALLISLQFAITRASVGWRWLRRVVTGEPSLLCHVAKMAIAAQLIENLLLLAFAG
jgi:hypothetical protein